MTERVAGEYAFLAINPVGNGYGVTKRGLRISDAGALNQRLLASSFFVATL